MSEDDYGRRRQTDFEYAQTGGKVAMTAPSTNPMEAMLRAAKMPEIEIAEAARVIPMGLQKMGPDAPEAEQKKFVAMMMGGCADGKPDVVAAVTKLASDIATPKAGGMTLQQKPAGSAYSSFNPSRKF